MLRFFRKYQRFFFIVITVMVIFAFAFFGVFSVLIEGSSQKGLSKEEREIKQLSFFLLAEPNLFSDDFLSKDFLKDKLAHVLVKEYQEKLGKKLQESWERMQRFVPYQHPQYPHISSIALWSQFAPKIPPLLKEIKGEASFSFPQMAELYLQKDLISSDMLRRILFHQMEKIGPDPKLLQDDCSLFGYHSAADWFSLEFIDLVSQTVLQVVKAAKEKGFTVSKKEALEKMQHVFLENLRKYSQEVDSKEVYVKQLHGLGMGEKELIALWQKILLFRKYLDKIANEVVSDSTISGDKKESVVVEKCELPKSMQNKGTLKAYLRRVSSPQDLFSPAPVEEVKARAPELIKRKYTVVMKTTNLEEVELKVTVKERGDWELSDEGWKALQKEFPSLKGDLPTREERFHRICKVVDREKIDNYAVKTIASLHPEWIQKTLQSKVGKEREISLFPYIVHESLGIKDSVKLAGLLDSLDEIPLYTDDQKSFFSFTVLKRKEDEVVSYDEAFALHLLEEEGDFQEIDLTALLERGKDRWKLVKHTLVLSNESEEYLQHGLAFLSEKESSKVFLGKDGPYFYTLLEKTIQDGREEKRLLLQQEAKRDYIKGLTKGCLIKS